jgi:NAD(P)-dependent dehydrogenase (short-subunit alcohol dehydrogenase family)
MNTELKTVVVTGASSGIGRSSASRLVRSGWRVFATVRKPADGERLRSELGPRLEPVILDVTDHASIAAAAEQVSSAVCGAGLDGLVNVAGIGMVRPVEYISPADLREIFEINVFGQVAVTQAFLPLIRKSCGRIVNISSVGAHMAVPFGSPINASKAAFGIVSDTLRMELRSFGIHVSVVEPGAIATPAVPKTLGNIEAVINDLGPAGAAQYGEMLKRFAARAYARETNGSSPDVVASAVHHALTSRHPRIRYRAGKHASLLATLATFLPDSLLDEVVLRIVGLPTKPPAAVSAEHRQLRKRTA